MMLSQSLGCHPAARFSKSARARATPPCRLQRVDTGSRASSWERRWPSGGGRTWRTIRTRRSVLGAFEDSEIPTGAYDLAIAASSFHWIDPETGYARVAALLKPSGFLALWWNRPVRLPGDDRFFELAEPAFRRIAPELADKELELPTAETVPAPGGERITESGLFGPVIERWYAWSQTVDSGEFIDWLGSYSRYAMLDTEARTQLFGELRTMIDAQLGGKVTRRIVTLLYMAKPTG
jgi:SAM-dependent methyltransferase